MSQPGLVEVRVETQGRKAPWRPRNNEFVYVNSAFAGSVTSVNNESRVAPPPPVTDVYREQYWACSRWPYTQRVLAAAVGILLGALIGLVISLVLNNRNDFSPIFRHHSVPD